MESTTILEHRVVRGSGSLTLREIEDLFIFAGAEPAWRGPAPPAFSNRQDAARAWIEGIKAQAPDRLEEILRNALHQVGDVADAAEPGAGVADRSGVAKSQTGVVPSDIRELLDRLTRGITRAIFPLSRRRAGKSVLSLEDEYDVQDLFHSMLRPWVKDIRTEEYTPSYAQTSSRMDFLLKKHRIVVETKFVRDRSHSKKIHQELTIDIAHYRQHPDAGLLWIVVYDPDGHLSNPEGLADIAGQHEKDGSRLEAVCYVVGRQGAESIGGAAQ